MVSDDSLEILRKFYVRKEHPLGAIEDLALVASNLVTLADENQGDGSRNYQNQQTCKQTEHEISQRRRHGSVPWLSARGERK